MTLYSTTNHNPILERIKLMHNLQSQHYYILNI